MHVLILCLLFLPFSLGAQAASGVNAPILPPVPAESPLFSDTGDAAIARRYVEWAEREAAAGRAAEALAGLERGADYGSASSDLSYLLAVFRSDAGRSRFSVLDSCRRALETKRWERYSPEDARLLEAKTLTELRRFEEALGVLERCDPERYETQYRRLRALYGLALSRGGVEDEFVRAMTIVLDRFPRETGPVRLLFEYAALGEPRNSLRPLVDAAIRRLPVLIDSDPELSYMAATFIRDKEEARRYTASYRAAAYRAEGNPNPASLPAALNLGLVNGKLAVDELFALPQQLGSGSVPEIDRELIVTVNGLLRNEDERSYLRQNLLTFSGVITEDRDHDGIVEGRTLYRDGMIETYSYDAVQSGEADLIISFAQSLPVRAEITLTGDSGQVVPLNRTERKQAILRWERYPAVLDTEAGGKRYIPRPLDYFFRPVRLIPLVLDGPDYPEREPLPVVLTERSLLSFANVFEQPSADFPGGTERIELSGGIPVKSVVYVENKKVSETEFSLGQPVVQRLDLDLDGRMETIRRFDSEGLVSAESDWNGDGVYEYAEIRQSDGSMKKFWDFAGDGIRDTQ